MVHMTRTTQACVQCWCNAEYFISKQCLENIGEGLPRVYISSRELKIRREIIRWTPIYRRKQFLVKEKHDCLVPVVLPYEQSRRKFRHMWGENREGKERTKAPSF